MSMSVCLSVWLSARISPEPHVRSTNSSVHVAFGRGSVLFRHGYVIPRGRGSFGDFPPIDNCKAFAAKWISTEKGMIGVHSAGEMWSRIALFTLLCCHLRWNEGFQMTLTVRCWNNQARMMLVAILGKMPRFFCRLAALFASESSSAVPSPDPILLSSPSPANAT